jgi:hypothetical protein
MDDNNNNNSKVDTGSKPLKNKKIRIFDSFQQQEDEMIEYWASITPTQRLRHLYEMIKISFRLPDDDLPNRHRSRTVKIIKSS